MADRGALLRRAGARALTKDAGPPSRLRLFAVLGLPMIGGMFAVTEAAVIRAAFERGGELLAVVELRRLFPAVTGNEHARQCVRQILGWRSPPATPPGHMVPLRPRDRTSD